jgi:transaldolase
MRIVLDTANIDEIRELARWGSLSGATAHPTLMVRSRGKGHRAVIREIADTLEARHLCTRMRGVREEAPFTTTTFWRGNYDTNPALRTAFLAASGARGAS